MGMNPEAARSIGANFNPSMGAPSERARPVIKIHKKAADIAQEQRAAAEKADIERARAELEAAVVPATEEQVDTQPRDLSEIPLTMDSVDELKEALARKKRLGRDSAARMRIDIDYGPKAIG